LLTKLDQKDEALEAAWTDFLEHPSMFTYQDLMRFVPKIERKEWREKALDAAATGADQRFWGPTTTSTYGPGSYKP
jgi:hypothetical protein